MQQQQEKNFLLAAKMRERDREEEQICEDEVMHEKNKKKSYKK